MVEYKEYSDEEAEIYDAEIARLREKFSSGASYDDACKSIEIEDEELRQIVALDILKIMIAEMHYQHRKTFEDIALSLGVPLPRIMEIHRGMVDEIMNTVKEGGSPDNTVH